MLTRNDLEARIVSSLDSYPEIAELYQAGDPATVWRVSAMADLISLLTQEIDIATIEPSIKSRDRSILADAVNKGILPIATPARHTLQVKNNWTGSQSLAQGRVITDNQGREWRLLSSVVVAAGETGEVDAEQSTVRTVAYTSSVSEIFHSVTLPITEDKHLAGLVVQDDEVVPNTFAYSPKWMNVEPLAYAYMLKTDTLRRLTVEFGDSTRAGITVAAGDSFNFTLTETYGELDAARLKEAALESIVSSAERSLKISFKTAGVVRAGANPVTITQMRFLASYPSFYDENASFLGNFDFLARKHFITRTQFISVWNETIQERVYGTLSVQDINHLHLAVTPNDLGEQASIQDEIALLLGRADSLYSGGIKSVSNVSGRVIASTVVERAYGLVITGRLAAVHDLDSVKAQISGLLLAKYGKGEVAMSRWLPNGINLQEVATLLRTYIPAFQDRISDFTVSGEDLTANNIKPHEWVYLSEGSIDTTGLTRSAESGGSLWTI